MTTMSLMAASGIVLIPPRSPLGRGRLHPDAVATVSPSLVFRMRQKRAKHLSRALRCSEFSERRRMAAGFRRARY
jgi:hypothetical protein